MPTMTVEEVKEAKRRKTMWSNRWTDYHNDVLEDLDGYCERYGLLPKTHLSSNNQKLEHAVYITALMLMQRYSGGNMLSTKLATFFRVFNGNWGNHHGASIARALKEYYDPLRKNKTKIIQMLHDVKKAVEGEKLNLAGDLCAILSVINDKCGVPITFAEETFFVEIKLPQESLSPHHTEKHNQLGFAGSTQPTFISLRSR